jgi:hypothetical protein
MDNIRNSVEAVRTRQQRQWIWQCVSKGLVFGGLAGCALAIARAISEGQIGLVWVAAAVVAGPALGLLWSLVTSRKESMAAMQIDQCCNLKDRVATALSFSKKKKSDVLHLLQIEDANEKASSIDATKVAPIKAPRAWLPGLGLAAVALTLGIVATPTVEVVAAPVVNSVIAEQADKAAAALEEIKEFNKEDVDPELEEIIKELSGTIAELKKPGVDPKEALAKFSEMEAALQKKQQQLDSGSTEQTLQKVGKAIALAHPMQAAGEALANGSFEEAAKELEALEMPELDRKTEKAVQGKLAEFDEEAGKAPGKKVREAIKKFAEGMRGGKRSKFREGVEGLASESKKQGRRKRLKDLLKKQCRCLGDCKGECEGECESAGDCNKKGGSNWGLGKSTNEPGDKTSKLKTGPQMNIKGQESDSGEVDLESIESEEQKQEAVREYRKQAKKYEQLSESVLAEEAIPLGHRQTIRRYFEMIRPSGEETDAVKAETDE